MYEINEEEAKKNTNPFARIEESGIYAATITEAYTHKAESGSEALRIVMVTDEGPELTHNIWVIKKDGTQNTMGVNEVTGQLLPVCYKRAVKPKPKKITVPVYSDGVRSEQDITVDYFEGLVGTQVNIAVQMQENEYLGKVAVRPVVIGWFDKDGNSAKEIVTKEGGGGDLAKMEERLLKTPIKLLSTANKPAANGNGATNTNSMQPNNSAQGNSTQVNNDQFDDDIPF